MKTINIFYRPLEKEICLIDDFNSYDGKTRITVPILLMKGTHRNRCIFSHIRKYASVPVVLFGQYF